MLIFNFHHVERQAKHANRRHLSITPTGLSRLIRTLRLFGFQIVSLRDVLTQTHPFAHSNRQVVLTLDDGYVNNLTEALPVLEAEQAPATVFVLPGRFAGTNMWDQGHLPETERDPLLSLEQMEALTASKLITLGSHGLLHQDFAKLAQHNPQTLTQEIHDSYRLLQTHFPQAFLPVLAYPWGHYSPAVIQAMKASPYQYAFTVETAPATQDSPRFEIPRYTAYHRDGNPAIFVAKLCRHQLLFA